MKRINISQSLIKDLDKYFYGKKCGHLIYDQYTKKVYSEPTESMALGQYFEYEATGALPKDGAIPKPDYLKDGKTLSKPYRVARYQAERFKFFCKEMGIEIISVGETKDKNGLVGTRDIHANWKGNKNIDGRGEITIDLKYSGLINNVYEEMGWGDMYAGNERGKQYQYHSTQSLQYTYIFDMPFYFWVFSSVNEGENIMIEMSHDETEIEEHLIRSQEAKKKFNILGVHDRSGVSAIPEYNDCKKCILYSKCEYRHDLPLPKKISILDR